MSEHTPTTASIRSDYIRGTAADFIATEGKRCPCGEAHGVKSETAQVTLVWDAETRAVAGPEFDRWLAAEIAAAERRGAVRALREASEALSRQPSTCKSPGCHRADQIILEDRADRIEEDRDHALAEARAALTAAGLLIEGDDHE